jgi:hypothetical protein
MAKLTEEDKRDWDLKCAYAQWAWRTQPKDRLNGLTPYEVVTGLTPRTPFMNRLDDTHIVERSIPDYVKELQKQMTTVREIVSQMHSEVAEKQELKGAKYYTGDPLGFDEGDFVLFKGPQPQPTIMTDNGEMVQAQTSPRLLPRARVTPYQIHQKIGPGAYFLCDPATLSTSLPFKQPVNIENLVPLDLTPLSEPYEVINTRLLIANGDDWKSGTVERYGIDGKVGVRFDSELDEIHWIDLTKIRYRWL